MNNRVNREVGEMYRYMLKYNARVISKQCGPRRYHFWLQTGDHLGTYVSIGLY